MNSRGSGQTILLKLAAQNIPVPGALLTERLGAKGVDCANAREIVTAGRGDRACSTAGLIVYCNQLVLWNLRIQAALASEKRYAVAPPH